jgi:hypothetical protein
MKADYLPASQGISEGPLKPNQGIFAFRHILIHCELPVERALHYFFKFSLVSLCQKLYHANTEVDKTLIFAHNTLIRYLI